MLTNLSLEGFEILLQTLEIKSTTQDLDGMARIVPFLRVKDLSSGKDTNKVMSLPRFLFY